MLSLVFLYIALKKKKIDDYSMVRFLPFDRSDGESMNMVLQHIDFAIQYGEDLEFKEPKVRKFKCAILGRAIFCVGRMQG